LKRFVNCNASVVVMKVKRSVVMTRKSLGMDLKSLFNARVRISIVTTTLTSSGPEWTYHILTSQEIANI
jgi:hypothetical protein